VNNSAISVFAFQDWPRKHMVRIQQGTFSSNTVLSIEMVKNLSIFPFEETLAMTDILKFDLQGSTNFSKPIAITMGFAAQPANTAVIFKTFDELRRQWVVPDFIVTVNTTDSTATVSVTHFSYWRIAFESVPVYHPIHTPTVVKDVSRKADSFIQIFDVLMLFILFTFFTIIAVLIAHRDNDTPFTVKGSAKV